MKLQLWTTVDGNPDELLGEIEVDDDDLRDAQTDSGSALELMQELMSEVHGGC